MKLVIDLFTRNERTLSRFKRTMKEYRIPILDVSETEMTTIFLVDWDRGRLELPCKGVISLPPKSGVPNRPKPPQPEEPRRMKMRAWLVVGKITNQQADLDGWNLDLEVDVHQFLSELKSRVPLTYYHRTEGYLNAGGYL